MTRTEVFPELEVTTLMPHLAWATLEIMADDVAALQVLVTGSDEDVTALKIACTDGKLKIEQPTYGLTYKLNTMRWMQVVIRIPRSWKGLIDAATISGPLKARGLYGTDLQLETVSGDIDADHLMAISIKLVSISGHIRATRAQSGSMHLRNVSGEINLAHAASQNIHVNSVSGNVALDLDNSFEELDANLVSARMRISAPISDADASIRSVTGRLLTSGVSIREEGPVLSVTSVSGDVELIRTEQQNA